MDLVLLYRSEKDLKKAKRTLERFTCGPYRLIPVKREGTLGKDLKKALELSDSPIVIFMHPEVIPSPGWNKALIQALNSRETAACSGPLTNIKDVPQSISRYMDIQALDRPEEASRDLLKRYRGSCDQVKFVLSLCAAFKREAIEKVGGFDEKLDGHLVDLDISLRLRLEGFSMIASKGCYFYFPHEDSINWEDPYPLYRKVSSMLTKVPTSQELWGIRFEKGVWKGEITKKTSIIIPVFNKVEYTIMCIESVRRWTYAPHEIIVVDNGSTDGTSEYIPRKGVLYIKLPKNIGFSRAVNIGIEASKGDYICILNNDVVVSPGWLGGLIEPMELDQTLGIVGPVTNEASGRQGISIYDYEVPFTPEYRRFVERWREKNQNRLFYTFRVAFFCTLIKRKVFQEIGLLDPNFGIGSFEDDDFCMRAIIGGYRIAVVRSVFVHHFGSTTLSEMDNFETFKKNWVYFSWKWRVPPEGYRIKGGKIIYRPEEVLKRWTTNFQIQKN